MRENVRTGSIIGGCDADVMVISNLTNGFITLSISEHKSTINRNPKTAKVKISRDQWDQIKEDCEIAIRKGRINNNQNAEQSQ